MGQTYPPYFQRFWPGVAYLALSTLLITLFTTLVFVVPYFLWVSPPFLLRKPLRIFAEPACIVAVAVAGILCLVRTPRNEFWITFKVAGLCAVGTSLVSSAYYLFALRRAARKQTYAPAH